MPQQPLVLVGCGYTLERVAQRVRSPADLRARVLASTRDEARAQKLSSLGVEVSADHVELARRAAGADVVYSLPPDVGFDDAIVAVLEEVRPARVVYLSSTGVYGAARGEVDERTPVDPEAAGPGAARVRAEERFRQSSLAAVFLRVAGIYGPGRGLHERLLAGTYRLPGDGSGRVSRVHVDDLAAAILVALEHAAPGDILNVADDEAAPQREVVAWLCDRLALATPAAVPLEAAPATLRGDRAIANSRLKSLGWRPRFPSYREGFADLLRLAGEGAQ